MSLDLDSLERWAAMDRWRREEFRPADAIFSALIAELRASRKVVEAAREVIKLWGDKPIDLADDDIPERLLRAALAELSSINAIRNQPEKNFSEFETDAPLRSESESAT